MTLRPNSQIKSRYFLLSSLHNLLLCIFQKNIKSLNYYVIKFIQQDGQLILFDFSSYFQQWYQSFFHSVTVSSAAIWNPQWLLFKLIKILWSLPTIVAYHCECEKSNNSIMIQFTLLCSTIGRQQWLRGENNEVFISRGYVYQGYGKSLTEYTARTLGYKGVHRPDFLF